MTGGFNQVVFVPPRSGMSVIACIPALFEGKAKSAGLNPVAGFEHSPDVILGFLQDASGVRLSPDQRSMARQVGLAIVREGEATLRNLVDAWGASPALAEFAHAVARVMLPGRSGRK